MKYSLWAMIFGLLMACNSGQEEQTTTTETETVVVLEYHDNGAVKIRGKNFRGKRSGTWQSYYPSGYKWSETSFKDGIKQGPTTSYYSNGVMRYDGQYYDDERNGFWTFYDTLGMVVERINMDAASAKGDSLINDAVPK